MAGDGRHVDDRVVEGLFGDPQSSLPAVGGVRVLYLRREGCIVGPQHEHAPVADGRAEFEGGASNPNLVLNVLGERGGLLRSQIAAHPAIDDRPAVALLLHGCEVDAVREVPVCDLQSGADRLDRPPSSVMFVRVVAEDREDGDVGLRSDALANRGHVAVATRRSQPIEVRRPSRLEGGCPIQGIERVVPEPVEDDVQDLLHVVLSAT